jgi:hypothetical protein
MAMPQVVSHGTSIALSTWIIGDESETEAHDGPDDRVYKKRHPRQGGDGDEYSSFTRRELASGIEAIEL